jgi:hypothetical protein
VKTWFQAFAFKFQLVPLRRGWRPSKLPFDVDQPGTPASLDLMKFNGSLALLMHRGGGLYRLTRSA